MVKKYIIKSYGDRDKIFIPVHKKWVQLSKGMTKVAKASEDFEEVYQVYYVYEIPYQSDFTEEYLTQNFETLIRQSESILDGGVAIMPSKEVNK